MNVVLQFIVCVYFNFMIDYWVLDWGYVSFVYLQLIDMQGRVLKEVEVRQG